MRLLLNHGITAGELYTNTPKTVCSRSKKWWIENYNYTNDIREAMSAPFKYCLGFILNKMLDEKIRFRIPGSKNYLDFKPITGDKFVEHRQNGQFQEIDFIQSDFTGYSLKYFIISNKRHTAISMFLGGDIKHKFIDLINNGDKFYTTETFSLDEIVDPVHSIFPKLEKKEIRRLLLFGFRRLDSVIKFGCTFTFSTTQFINCYVHIGFIYLDPFRRRQHYLVRRSMKLRRVQNWAGNTSSIYYIGLSGKYFDDWVVLNKKSKCVVKFKDVVIKNIYEEFYHRGNHIHMFKIDINDYMGRAIWVNELSVRKVEYLGILKGTTLTKADKSWLHLKKEYEKINN